MVDTEGNKRQTGRWMRNILVACIISTLWFNVLIIAGGSVVSGMTRPIQGESVTVSRSFCISTILVVELVPVVGISLVGVRERWTKLMALAGIFVMFWIVYPSG